MRLSTHRSFLRFISKLSLVNVNVRVFILTLSLLFWWFEHQKLRQDLLLVFSVACLISKVWVGWVFLEQILLQPFKIFSLCNFPFFLFLLFIVCVWWLDFETVKLHLFRRILVIYHILYHVLSIWVSIRYESINFLNSQKDLPLETSLRLKEHNCCTKSQSIVPETFSHWKQRSML